MEKKDFDNTLLPLVKRVISKTLSQELAFYSEEEMMLVKSRMNSENRDRKIESILEGTEYIENRLEDDPEYKEIISRYRIVLRK
jgi:hypothetical protein